MVLALWGAFQLSLFVVIVQKIFNLSDAENIATTHIRLTRTAASTIQSAFRYYKQKKLMKKEIKNSECWDEYNYIYQDLQGRKIY